MNNHFEVINVEAETALRKSRLEAYAKMLDARVNQMSSDIILDLVQERKRQQKTQQDIADITGLKASNIARFEKGERVPTLTVLEKYASALGKRIHITLQDET